MKPWQMTRVFLSIHTFAVEDMALDPRTREATDLLFACNAIVTRPNCNK